MKLIPVITMLALPIGGFAQASLQPVAMHYFAAEGNPYYKIMGAVPGSGLAFYSERSGGHVLATIAAGPDGTLLKKGSKDFTPAFVLSLKEQNAAGHSGTGLLTFTGTKEFTFGTPTTEQAGLAAAITWQAASVSDDLAFHLLKSTDGITYAPLAVVPGRTTSGLVPYTYTDEAAGDLAFYKIEISNKSGTLYTSSIMSIGNGTVKVYPTIADNTVHISYANAAPDNQYRILNSEGRVVQSGNLQLSGATLTVGDLAAGNYIVVAGNDAHRGIGRFVKK